MKSKISLINLIFMKKIGCFSIIIIILVISFIGSFFKVDIKDESAVINDMQGTWVGNDHESGFYTHYKIQISGTNFKGWHQITYTIDEPSWSNEPDETGTFKLSPVQGYTNSSGNYRNINFYKEGGGYGNNSLEARVLTKMLIYDDGCGLYVAGWGEMTRK
jgi:hypothetical protein